INQLAKFGLNLRGGDSPTSKDYMLLADAVENREDAKIINNLILRSMSKAEYSPDNIGHFGLALEKYAHFTSPIRRYADLQLHRVIKFILEKQQKRDWGKIGARSYTKPELVALGTKCTDREIAAANAEREVDASLACVYMEKFIGQTVEGTITGCTSFGLFVYLDNFGVDGMVYVGSFDSYMTYNEKDQSLVSDRGQVYSIGKKIKVVVTSVNHEERKVLLAPANMVSKGELNNLKKTCQYALDKRNKIKENTKTQDKETILNSLSDIATAKDANEQDQVVKKRNYGSLMTSPFGEEFNSSAMDMDDIGVFRKKSKKKSFRKGK
ncbi:MAG: RNB domain-containing ribonuclease, partial [Succinivibrio sp.]|nr:RNB domain-containing ribonuclease [Succinivibrio sp.]